MSYKIALDLGTSGERAQALDERGGRAYPKKIFRFKDLMIE